MYESDDRLSEKIRMLKCVKCGSKNKLKPYKFTQRTLVKHTKRYNRYKVESINVPSCQKCFDENTDWVNKTDKMYSSTLCFGGLFCCLTFILWIILGVLFILMDFWTILAILAAIGTIGLLFSQLYKFKALRDEANLNNYIDISSYGEVYVRPKDSKKWISYQSWINSVMNILLNPLYHSYFSLASSI